MSTAALSLPMRVAAPRHIPGIRLLAGQSRIPAIESGAITFENLQEE